MKVLKVKVAEPMEATLDRARAVMEGLDAGGEVEPYAGIGFDSVPQLLAVFTPKRWALLAYLREQGPQTVADLARGLGRDYKNVHGDVAALEAWLMIERDERGRVMVPWDEIDLRLPLARHVA